MDYRKLWIINALGNRFDLSNPENKIGITNLSGFGFVRGYETQKVGNSELVTTQEFQLTDITGELIFFKGSNGLNYQAYTDFIQFMKYKPLELHYQTPNVLEGQEYYCDILFTGSDKNEVTYVDGALHVAITMHRLTQWLTTNDYTITLNNNAIGTGKYYALTRPYHYSGTNLSGTDIVNQGTDDVGFVIKINGECQNPTFTLTQDSVNYAICKITGTYDYVMIDSVEKTEQIYLELNGSTITNPESYQDFTIANGQSYVTWCKLKVGTSTFAFTCGNIASFTGTIEISFKNSFVSV